MSEIDLIQLKAREGFWLAAPNTPIACSGAIHMKARSVTKHLSNGQLWLCFHDAEETICHSDGTRVYAKNYPELWIPDGTYNILVRDWRHEGQPALAIQTEESENVSNPLKERCQVTLAERETLRNTRHGTFQQ